MFRSLSIYPVSADALEVEEHSKSVVGAFSQSPGFVSSSMSVGPLMGPGAKLGKFARVVAVDFDSLESALGALQAESFQDLLRAGEQLTDLHFLFETEES
jgi:hypothetical protein